MSSSSSAPKLPLWVFFATDVVLIAAAWFIADHSGPRMSQTAIIASVGCIFAGILVLCVPLVLYYERQKNEMLDDRQRALETLARTVASSAEQISIATSGLHEITEIAQRNLKHAEQLPHKLQEKIAEFQAQLANANDTERDELEHELEELRASETERMQTIADRITRAAGDFAKLESTTHQHLLAANEAVSKLSLGTASAIGKAQAAAELALAQARQEAARTVGEATGNAVKAIEAAKAVAITDLAAQFNASIASLKTTIGEMAGLVTRLESAASRAPAPSAPPADHAESAPASATVESTMAVPTENTGAASVAPPPGEPAVAATESAPAPSKRARKARREESAPPAPETIASPPATPAPEAGSNGPSEPTAAASEPAPILPERIAEVAPIAPNTAEPFSMAASPSAPAVTTESAAAVEPGATHDEPRPARKRAAKRSDQDQPALGLEIDPASENGESVAGVIERVLSSDGATRLIVTAYIGIGNRLFIRGSGPGLSWDKGVPLQFVSIGKWRWETSEANTPVQFKLLKNDEQESAALGTLTIEPGHQHEVTATFG